MDKKTKILKIIVVIETILLFVNNTIIDDQQKYIDGIRSQKAVCDGQLETVKQDYRQLIEELEKLKGELDG